MDKDRKNKLPPENILNSDPNFDDFGVWLAWRNGDIDDSGNKTHRKEESTDE